MNDGEFEIARVELLNIMADMVGGRNIEKNRLIVNRNIDRWNYKIDNLTTANEYDRILYVEMCFQYYRIRDSHFPALL